MKNFHFENESRLCQLFHGLLHSNIISKITFQTYPRTLNYRICYQAGVFRRDLLYDTLKQYLVSSTLSGFYNFSLQEFISLLRNPRSSVMFVGYFLSQFYEAFYALSKLQCFMYYLLLCQICYCSLHNSRLTGSQFYC